MASNDNNNNWAKVGAWGALTGIAAGQGYAVKRWGGPGGAGYFTGPTGFLNPKNLRASPGVLAASLVTVGAFALAKHHLGARKAALQLGEDQLAKRKGK